MPPAEMTTADEMRLIADSLHTALPFQAARLHVLAAYVEGLDLAAAARRTTATAAATPPPRHAAP
jgi:hypothetical protein